MGTVREKKKRKTSPKTTWRRTVEKERRDGGWGSWDEVRVSAADREKLKGSVKALYATRHWEDRSKNMFSTNRVKALPLLFISFSLFLNVCMYVICKMYCRYI